MKEFLNGIASLVGVAVIVSIIAGTLLYVAPIFDKGIETSLYVIYLVSK